MAIRSYNHNPADSSMESGSSWKKGKNAEFSIQLGVYTKKGFAFLPNGALSIDRSQKVDPSKDFLGCYKNIVIDEILDLPQVKALRVGEMCQLAVGLPVEGINLNFKFGIEIRRNRPDPYENRREMTREEILADFL